MTPVPAGMPCQQQATRSPIPHSPPGFGRPIDLNDHDTSLPGEMAFPMLAHGTFVGAVLCGPKRTGERYAPDEIQAIRELAHALGLAVDNLERDDRDVTRFARISSMFAAISARLDQIAPPEVGGRPHSHQRAFPID